MRTGRLGCLTPVGLAAALITIAVLAGAAFASGGAMFSPGGLNAVTGPALQSSAIAAGGAVTSHAELGGRCAACHAAPWSADNMRERCLDCHQQIKSDLGNPDTLHGSMKIDGSAPSRTVPADCRLCHTEHHGPDAVITRLDVIDFPHEVTGFSLAAHTLTFDDSKFECKNCHAQQFTRIQMQVCQDCHAERDPAYRASHAEFGRNCRNCHDGLDSYGSAFDHAKTGFALEGKHAQSACGDCHAGAANLNMLADTPPECAACHAEDDPHAGQLGKDCAACHNPAGWKPAQFDHAQRAGFALAGKHAQAQCAACHPNNQFKDTASDCAACHAKDDAHAGQLGNDCAACHDPGGWKPAQFDHTQRTGFALAGKHIQAQCTACHPNNQFKDTASDCAACHAKEDAHEGQFGADCALCHNPGGWKPAQFDHTQRTGFALAGKHAQAQCSACHANNQYKATASDCAACHSKDDAHAGQFGADCALCHNPGGWKPAQFDHAQRTGFALAGKHAQTQCSACHANNQYKATASDCAACHSQDDAHRGQFGADCALCHSPSGWKPAQFDHAQRTGFALAGKHAQVQCSACHANNQFTGAASNCSACHAKDDQHNGQYGSDCAQCHTPQGWSQVTFDHARSGFPLTGAHNGQPCSRCHSGGSFNGLSTACSSCHADPAVHAGMFGSDCAACHSTSAWRPVSYNGPHSFPMSHGKADTCGDCHTNGLTSWTCYNCHNQGEIAKKHTEEGISDYANCLRCHPTGNEGDDGGGDDD